MVLHAQIGPGNAAPKRHDPSSRTSPLTSTGPLITRGSRDRESEVSHLDIYGNENTLPSDTRRAGRAISRQQAQGQVRIAQADVDTDVAIAKGDSYTAATGSAMGNVIRVAQAQRQLEQLAPEASGRLAMLADEHALTMADNLAELRRNLRRR